jgi:hypothetical protein
MTPSRHHPGPRLPRAAAIALTCALALAAASSAAFAAPSDPLAGVGSLRKITVTATVTSIDPVTRHVVVTNSAGEHFTLKAPEGMHNFDKLQVGQKITATYAMETAFALSTAGGKLPPDTETTIAAHAAKGELPAVAVRNHIVVTGAILGIDLAAHTLKLVSPRGGEVYTVAVTTTGGRAAMPKLKVGDKITAYISEGLLITAKPA